VTRDRLLIANLGAEEGDDWRAHRREPAVRCAARLWRGLFGPAARWLDDDASDGALAWPPALGAAPSAPVFEWLDAPGDATAWLNTDEAERAASAAGRSLSGAPPAAVRRVHDKAFAHREALAAGLVPAPLRETVHVLDPAVLRDEAEAVRRIEAVVAGWPPRLRRRFTLKPRFGSSGRGRVAGADGRADTPEVRGALARLADRGGAMLEPWLPRRADLSAHLVVEGAGGLRLLGTTEQVVTPSGVPVGHRGLVDARGRVSSGTAYDEALREAAAGIGAAAGTHGFFGPCGLDAFAFEDPIEGDGGAPELRPVVELNARFTTGLVALGWVRHALGTLRAHLGLVPGELRAFYFGLDAPPGGWPEDAGDGSHALIPIGWGDGAPRPALLLARSRDGLDRLLAASPAGPRVSSASS
jgi:hypothetical protein